MNHIVLERHKGTIPPYAYEIVTATGVTVGVIEIEGQKPHMTHCPVCERDTNWPEFEAAVCSTCGYDLGAELEEKEAANG